MNREQRRIEQKFLKNPDKFKMSSMHKMNDFMNFVKRSEKEERIEKRKLIVEEIPDAEVFGELPKVERLEILKNIIRKHGVIISNKRYIDPNGEDEMEEEFDMEKGKVLVDGDVNEYKKAKHKFVREAAVEFFIVIAEQMVKSNEHVTSFRDDITDRIKKRKWGDKIIPKLETFINKINELDYYEVAVKQLPQEVMDDVVMMAMLEAYKGYDEKNIEYAAEYPNIGGSIQRLGKSEGVKSIIQKQVTGAIEKYEEAYARQRDCIKAMMAAFPLVDWKSCLRAFSLTTDVLGEDCFPDQYRENYALQILLDSYFLEGKEKMQTRSSYPEIVSKIHEISDKYDEDYKNGLLKT